MSLKLVIAETIGIDEKTLNELAKDILPQDVEIKYYNSLADSDEEKIKRCKDADAVIIANKPYRKNVLKAILCDKKPYLPYHFDTSLYNPNKKTWL